MKSNKKLFNSQMHPELMGVVDKRFRQACQGVDSQFLFNIDDYLMCAPNAFKYYYDAGASFIKDNILCVKGTDFSAIDNMYVAMLGVQLNCAYILINVEENGFPCTLHANNTGFLKYGIKNGVFGVDSEDKLFKSLMSKTLKGVEEATYTSVRLDLDGVIGGNPVYKLVVPRSRVNIGLGKQMVMIPLPFMYHIEDILAELLGENVFKFVKDTVAGKIEHKATLSPNTVRRVYDGYENNMIASKIRKTAVGYNLYQLRFLCYDVESSLSTIGSASFRPEMLDSIKVIGEKEVDKSQYNIDYDMLRGVFKTQVSKFTKDNFDDFKLFDTSTFANNIDKAEALVSWSNNIGGRDLYICMKQNSKLFGDVDQRLETRSRVSPKIVKMLQSVELPDDLKARVAAIKGMLDTGLVKMTMISKANRVYERVCSNNDDVLKRMLGKNYVAKFESPRAKINYVKDMLAKGEIDKKSDMEKVLSECNLLGYVDGEKILGERSNKNVVLGELDRAISELNKKVTHIPNTAIIYRNVYANNEREFFGRAHIANILNVEYVENTAK